MQIAIMIVELSTQQSGILCYVLQICYPLPCYSSPRDLVCRAILIKSLTLSAFPEYLSLCRLGEG